MSRGFPVLAPPLHAGLVRIYIEGGARSMGAGAVHERGLPCLTQVRQCRIPVYGKSMRENIPAHVLRQIKEEIKHA